jgi:tetratricopeptide (TPR) repeat protein
VAPEARPFLETAIARCRAEPSNPAAFAELGRAYHGNQQPMLAAASYEAAIALGDDTARTHYFLGLIFGQHGETERALEQFRRAREREPNYAPIPYQVASVLLDAGRAQEAISEFREATRIDPGSATSRIGLARALRQTGDLVGALGTIEEALRRDPENPSAHQVAGSILNEMGRADEAAAHFAKLRIRRADVVVDPWFRDVQSLGASVSQVLTRADFMIESGNAASAVKTLEPLAAAHPRRADVQKAFARALARQDLARARPVYELAAGLDPADASILAELASTCLDLGDLGAATRAAEAALQADARQCDASVVLGSVALRRGDPRGALHGMDAVLAVRRDVPLAHIVRGDALLALGQPDEAAKSFQAALALRPDIEYARTRGAEAEFLSRKRAAESR